MQLKEEEENGLATTNWPVAAPFSLRGHLGTMQLKEEEREWTGYYQLTCGSSLQLTRSPRDNAAEGRRKRMDWLLPTDLWQLPSATQGHLWTMQLKEDKRMDWPLLSGSPLDNAAEERKREWTGLYQLGHLRAMQLMEEEDNGLASTNWVTSGQCSWRKKRMDWPLPIGSP